MTLDRIDNNGDYTPENTRLVTRRENSKNTSRSRFWIVGVVKYDSLASAGKANSVSPTTIKIWCDGRYGKASPRDWCYSIHKYPSMNILNQHFATENQ